MKDFTVPLTEYSMWLTPVSLALCRLRPFHATGRGRPCFKKPERKGEGWIRWDGMDGRTDGRRTLAVARTLTLPQLLLASLGSHPKFQEELGFQKALSESLETVRENNIRQFYECLVGQACVTSNTLIRFKKSKQVDWRSLYGASRRKHSTECRLSGLELCLQQANVRGHSRTQKRNWISKAGAVGRGKWKKTFRVRFDFRLVESLLGWADRSQAVASKRFCILP